MRDFVSYLKTPEQQFNLLAIAIVEQPLSGESLASEATVGIFTRRFGKQLNVFFLGILLSSAVQFCAQQA